MGWPVFFRDCIPLYNAGNTAKINGSRTALATVRSA